MATIMDSVMGSMGQSRPDAGGEGYVMALDAGTTSVRAILFDEYGCKVAQAQRSISISYPHPGWVEQDPV